MMLDFDNELGDLLDKLRNLTETEVIIACTGDEEIQVITLCTKEYFNQMVVAMQRIVYSKRNTEES